jgi:hypothetical protein
MKSYFDDQPSVYDVTGEELRIHWGIEQFNVASPDGENRTQWVANEAVCSVRDSRAQIISSIIRACYSVDDEFSLINNQSDKPEKYSAYQAFRLQAKTLADGWIARS